MFSFSIFISNCLLRNSKNFNTNNNFLHYVRSVRLFCSQRDNSSRYPPKYTLFKEEESEIIFDVEEERAKKQINVVNKCTSQEQIFERSLKSVFGVEELVELVKSNNANNVFVIKVLPELNYVDYMVILSGTSRRHLNGLAAIIRKEFKLRRSSGDFVPNIEGIGSDWIAIDLGNIAVHMMMESVRDVYDLESLWTVGAKYDLKLNNAKDDEVLQLLKKHSFSLDDLQPRAGT